MHVIVPAMQELDSRLKGPGFSDRDAAFELPNFGMGA